MAFNLGSILVKLGLDNSGLEKGLKESKGELSSFGGEVTKIGAAIGVAFGAKEVLDFGKAAFNLGEKFKPVNAAFQRTGASLAELRSATGGAVSDFNLLQNTVRAQNFGIPVERLAEAFRFATIRAAETGESVDYLVNSIVTGIGRKSALVLDNLGISAVDIQEEFQKTGDFAQAAFNLIERESKKSSLSVDDAVTSAARLTAEFENLQLAIGQILAQEGIINFLGGLAEGLKVAAQVAKDFSLSDLVPIFFAGSVIDATQALKELAKQEQIQAGFQRDRQEAVDTFKRYFQSINEAKDGTVGLNEALQQQVGFLRQLQDQALINVDPDTFELYQRQIEAIQKYVATQLKANEATEQQSNTLAGLRQKLEGLNQEFELVDYGTQKFFELGAEITRTDNKIKDLVLAATTLTQAFSSIPKIEGIGLSGDLFTPTLPNITPQVQPGVESLKESYAEIQQATLDLGNFVADSFTTLGESIGDALSGTFDGSTFLKSLAAFGAAFGKQLVAIGVAALALKNTFKSPFGAIAAGVGLIALSKIIANTASNASAAVSNIGSGGVSSLASSGSNIGGFNSFNNEPPVFVVKVGPHEFMTAYDYSSGVVGRTTGRRRG